MPFTAAQLLQVFAAYNAAVWPGQVLWLLVALATVALVWRGGPASDRLMAGALALLWAWMAIAYHYLFFALIDPAAYLFGLLFLIEAALFAHQGIALGQLRFRIVRDWQTGAGLSLAGYALLVYPAVGYLTGWRYPAFASFGLPCPSTMFTVGMLLLVRGRRPRFLLTIPVIWSALGASAAVLLPLPADLGLIVAGVAGLAFMLAPAGGPSWPVSADDG